MAVIFEASFSREPLKEFEGTGPSGLRVRALTTPPTTAVEILSVVCAFSKPFPDLVITWELLTSFVITSTFANAFDRSFRVLVQPEPTAEAKSFVTATSTSGLPEDFKSIVEVLPATTPIINIPFTVTYRDQEGTPTWSGSKTATWNLSLTINEQYTAQIAKQLVQQGSGYQSAISRYPEATLPPVT